MGNAHVNLQCNNVPHGIGRNATGTSRMAMALDAVARHLHGMVLAACLIDRLFGFLVGEPLAARALALVLKKAEPLSRSSWGEGRKAEGVERPTQLQGHRGCNPPSTSQSKPS